MKEYEISNGIIESVSIDDGDRGLLTTWLFINFESGTQGFGGYSLYLPDSFDNHKILSVAGHFIFRCMQIAGVTKWDDMKGKAIRIKKKNWASPIEEIGHIIKNDWFNPSEDFKNV